MKIKITETPNSLPPSSDREAWVGIEMEAVFDEAKGSYTVSYQEAMNKLKTHNKAAYKWWRKRFKEENFANGLFFEKQSCKKIFD